MTVSSRLISTALRLSQVALAATVAGLIGHYIHVYGPAHAWHSGRFIYTEVLAAVSIVLALAWLIPNLAEVPNYPFDSAVSVAWIIAFGLLVAFIGPVHCDNLRHNGYIYHRGLCEEWKAVVALSLLSALLWLASALYGYKFPGSAPRDADGPRANGTPAGNNRRKWYRSHGV